MFQLFQKNTHKHVWSGYRRLMNGEKHDIDGEDCSTEKEHENTFIFLTRLDD